MSLFTPSGCGNDGQFKDLCQLLNIAHLSSDSRLVNNKKLMKKSWKTCGHHWSERRTKNLDEIREWAKFQYGPMNKLSQVFQDPQVLHNGMVREMVSEKKYEVIFIDLSRLQLSWKDDTRDLILLIGHSNRDHATSSKRGHSERFTT